MTTDERLARIEKQLDITPNPRSKIGTYFWMSGGEAWSLWKATRSGIVLIDDAGDRIRYAWDVFDTNVEKRVWRVRPAEITRL